jgi:hypothetical protein
MKTLIPSVLALFFLLASSNVALADPPLGTWVGDNGSLTFTLSSDGNYVIPGNSTGTWSWQQNNPSGGVLTLTYIQYTVGPRFTSHMYFAIQFIDANTATLTDPSGLRDTIRKQPE